MARQITHPRFSPAEFKRTVYRATLEVGTTPAELVDPSFFLNVATGLRAGDLIECVMEDGSAYAELLVRSASKIAVKVGILRVVSFDDEGEEPGDTAADGFSVDFNMQDKWRVVRKADGVVVKDQLATEAAAKRALATHLKTV